MELPDAPVVDLTINGKKRKFDLDDPKLPAWVADGAFSSGGYPHSEKMGGKSYEKELRRAQEELVKVAFHLQESGERIVVVFEGRDAAGKGGSIGAFRENLNPRSVRGVALAKPSDVERGQWYFQRYVQHLPTAGEIVLFDRSWYNRAGVEPVMGFCTPEQTEKFLEEAPRFEQMIVNDGIRLFKFWLNIGQEMQLKRFHDRRHDGLKVWKLSPVDIKALSKWNEYTRARNRMLELTHTSFAPWTVVRANDKKRVRLNVIRTVLRALDYQGKDDKRIGPVDAQIVHEGPAFARADIL